MNPINLTAPVNQLGFGTVGLNATLALRELGCEVALWPMGPIECPPDKLKIVEYAVRARESYSKFAPSIRIAQQFDLAQHVGKGVHAAITFFERNRLYDNEINQLQNQDVVITSSVWMRDLLAAVLCGPKLAIARPGVDTSIFSPQLSAQARRLPNKSPNGFEQALSMADSLQSPASSLNRENDGPTIFMAVGKWEVRKGHDVLPSLFERAFTPADNFKLILVTANPFLTQDQHSAWVAKYARLGDRVEIFTSRLADQRSLAQVMARADCGVFLSRAEGWNLDAAEMLAMGKHIIITNFSAHTEFATRANSMLVDVTELEPANDGKWFDGFGQWARLGPAQQEQAIGNMRRIHQLKQSGSLGVNQAGIDSMAAFTWKAYAESILKAVAV